MTPLTDPDINAIAARGEAATAGPWHARCVAGHHDDAVWQIDECLTVNTSDGDMLNGRDAAFIAAARADVPRLCDELLEARRLLRELVAHVDARNKEEWPLTYKDDLPRWAAARAFVRGKDTP